LDSEIDLARNSEAEGVGLYRTEYQFLLRDAFPVEEEQYHGYRADRSPLAWSRHWQTPINTLPQPRANSAPGNRFAARIPV
jgi:hypothetical protein